MLGANGIERLVRAGVQAFDLRLPQRTYGEHWSAAVHLTRKAWAAGAQVYCHSWEGSWDGRRSTARRGDGVHDAMWVSHRVELLEITANKGTHSIDGRRYFGDVGRYRGNFERDVWRGSNGHANPHADEYLAGFYDELERLGFRHSRSCDYLGFANPDRHYRDSDLDGDGHQDDTIPDWLPARVDRLAVMLYQTRARDMAEVLRMGLSAWPESQHVAVFVGVGRLDPQHGQIGDDDELLSFLRYVGARVEEVVLYVGHGAEGQLLVGHAGFPSLDLVVPRIHALHVRGSDVDA